MSTAIRSSLFNRSFSFGFDRCLADELTKEDDDTLIDILSEVVTAVLKIKKYQNNLSSKGPQIKLLNMMNSKEFRPLFDTLCRELAYAKSEHQLYNIESYADSYAA